MFTPDNVFFFLLQTAAALIILFHIDWLPDVAVVLLALALVISGIIDLFGG